MAVSTYHLDKGVSDNIRNHYDEHCSNIQNNCRHNCCRNAVDAVVDNREHLRLAHSTTKGLVSAGCELKKCNLKRRAVRRGIFPSNVLLTRHQTISIEMTVMGLTVNVALRQGFQRCHIMQFNTLKKGKEKKGGRGLNIESIVKLVGSMVTKAL